MEVLKVILKRNTHASRKEAQLVENKNETRNRRDMIAKANVVIFSLYPLSFIIF